MVASASVCAVLAGMLGLLFAGESTPSAVDRWVLETVPDAHELAALIDFVGEPAGFAVAVTLLAAGCLASGRRRLAVLAVVGPALSPVVTTLLKPVAGRTINGDHLTYPSGHTAVATALAIVLALLVVDLLRPGRLVSALLVTVAAVTAGVAMGWSQVVLSAHYPTDTFGGFCTAVVVVTGTALLVDRWADRCRNPAQNAP